MAELAHSPYFDSKLQGLTAEKFELMACKLGDTAPDSDFRYFG